MTSTTILDHECQEILEEAQTRRLDAERQTALAAVGAGRKQKGESKWHTLL